MDPIIWFFALGVIAGLAKSDLRLPPAIYDLLSMLLLLTIGLKGGVELAKSPMAGLVPQVIAVLAIGFLLPFLIPAVVKATYALLNPISLQNPQTIIWSLSAWAFIPASMIMRGLAMRRVASMIADKRRRKYASAHQDGGLQTA